MVLLLGPLFRKCSNIASQCQMPTSQWYYSNSSSSNYSMWFQHGNSTICYGYRLLSFDPLVTIHFRQDKIKKVKEFFEQNQNFVAITLMLIWPQNLVWCEKLEVNKSFLFSLMNRIFDFTFAWSLYVKRPPPPFCPRSQW